MLTTELDKTHAVITPGQGNQTLGMGLDLAQVSPAAAEVMDYADRALSSRMGYSFRELLWYGKRDSVQLSLDDAKAAITLTEFAQPAVLEDSIARHASFKESNLLGRPAWFAGNSVGLVSTLVNAGALSLEGAVELGRGRSEAFRYAIDHSPKTTMVALNGVDQDVVDQVREKYGLEVCLINTDGQVVVGGEVENKEGRDVQHALSFLRDELKLEERQVIPLDVDAAFHSRYMEAALPRYEKVVNSIDIQAPSEGNVVGGSSVCVISTPDEIRRELMRQLTNTERWSEVMHYLRKEGVSMMTELNGVARLALMDRKMFKGRVDKIVYPNTDVILGYKWLGQERMTVAGGSAEVASRDEVRDWYYNWIYERVGTDPSELSEDLHWKNDAVLDSEDIIALRSDLRAEFGMVVPDEEAEKNVTIGLAIDATWGLVKPAV